MSYIISWFESYNTHQIEDRPWWNLSPMPLETIKKTHWMRREVTTPTMPDLATLKVIEALFNADQYTMGRSSYCIRDFKIEESLASSGDANA